MEIMSPLPRHERYGAWIGKLVQLVCTDREINVQALKSTTFKVEELQRGLEPDECFYIQNAEAAATMEDAFDPAINPPPDLAVEIDIAHRSIERQPIYAALGVPELWRYDGSTLRIMHLKRGKYIGRATSRTFPFLPIRKFSKFIPRMLEADQVRVVREFRAWLAKLPS
jgi:Uma2 family endonuclease